MGICHSTVFSITFPFSSYSKSEASNNMELLKQMQPCLYLLDIFVCFPNDMVPMS